MNALRNCAFFIIFLTAHLHSMDRKDNQPIDAYCLKKECNTIISVNPTGDEGQIRNRFIREYLRHEWTGHTKRTLSESQKNLILKNLILDKKTRNFTWTCDTCQSKLTSPKKAKIKYNIYNHLFTTKKHNLHRWKDIKNQVVSLIKSFMKKKKSSDSSRTKKRMKISTGECPELFIEKTSDV